MRRSGGLQQVSEKRGFEVCEYLLITHMTETLAERGQSTPTAWYMISQPGHH